MTMKKLGLRVCLDRRHRLISGLDGVDGLQTASRSAGCRLLPPVDGRSDGRSRRPFARHRPGRSDAADHGRPGAGRARGRRAGGKARHRVPSQAHPLLGRPAPALVLKDATGKIRDLGAQARGRAGRGRLLPGCHLHGLRHPLGRAGGGAAAVPRARRAGAGRQRRRPRSSRGNGCASSAVFRFPLLSDPDHAVALSYGVWKPRPGGDANEGEALHGTFIVDRGGSGPLGSRRRSPVHRHRGALWPSLTSSPRVPRSKYHSCPGGPEVRSYRLGDYRG